MNQKKILLASMQIRGIIGTGGLADVAASVASAVNIGDNGFTIDLIMPAFYQKARDTVAKLKEEDKKEKSKKGKINPEAVMVIDVPYGNETPKVKVEVFESDTLVNNTKTFLLVCNVDFKKDSAEEALFFARSVCEFCKERKYSIIHCNDWNTGLIPVYLKTRYCDLQIKTLYTAHNAEGGYQGGDFDNPEPILWTAGLQKYKNDLLQYETDVSPSVVHKVKPEDEVKFNFLKAAISAADRVNTVSKTYHGELLQPNFGGGLCGVFKELENKSIFTGILNGIDKGEWNPNTDKYLKTNEYNLNFKDVSGALKTRAELRKKDFWVKYWDKQKSVRGTAQFDKEQWEDAENQSKRIVEDPKVPIIGIVTRIDYQKVPILVKTLNTVIQPDCGFQFILMGEDGGDNNGKGYTQDFKNLKGKYPDKFLFFNVFDYELSHLLYALFDIFVVPSVWEPCGLTQMYSLNYGAPAIVRKTGGLSESINRDKDTGFQFLEDPPRGVEDGRADFDGAAKEFAAAIASALDIKKNDPAQWKKIMEAGMKEDFSWENPFTNPVKNYIDIYKELTE